MVVVTELPLVQRRCSQFTFQNHAGLTDTSHWRPPSVNQFPISALTHKWTTAFCQSALHRQSHNAMNQHSHLHKSQQLCTQTQLVRCTTIAMHKSCTVQIVQCTNILQFRKDSLAVKERRSSVDQRQCCSISNTPAILLLNLE